MSTLTKTELEQCLSQLNAVDAVLMAHRELAVAVHLSLVIELLEQRLEAISGA